ncbi:LOW QUALITY PROTEIN: hypothetical protein Cgig2_024691 [Carnegiea gigantea]|uniref:Uncharacterized protein n=1 Tax=Carnegiea gigantea TaxID=171969 RepID=A0A9Q1JWA1_9CARY|nr:LOW QUALITY PROTEIN: hypothetical protein Cgig2_024691 [Carnegiea gigantea]
MEVQKCHEDVPDSGIGSKTMGLLIWDWNTMKQARLDRALCNMAWRLKFPKRAVRHLLQAQSDHVPPLIALTGFSHIAQTCKPFCFQATWTTHSKLNTVLRETWKLHAYLMANLSNLATELTHWNKRSSTTYSNENGSIQCSLVDGGSRYLLKLEARLCKELNTTLTQIESLWHKKVTKAMYHEVIARVDRKLTGWKAKCLSLAGRTTVMQPAVIAIPSYTMQTAKLPRSVCDEENEEIPIGGHNHGTKTPSRGLRDCNEREGKWLGLRSMWQLNLTYFIKLGCRLANEPKSLWAKS